MFADIPDVEIVGVGANIGNLLHLPTVSSGSIPNKMYINVEQPVGEAGWLMGIEAVVETAGILEFRVRSCKKFKTFSAVYSLSLHILPFPIFSKIFASHQFPLIMC